MRPQIQKIPLSEQSSFMADRFYTPYFETPWHYHPEYEVVLILKGWGKRFIGNHVADYEEGDLCFIGSNLPHLYKKDESETVGGSLVIHFREDFLGKDFASIPEMQKIKLLFERASMGVQVNGKSKSVISQVMNEMTELKGMDRLVSLLQLLNVLADVEEYDLLSSPEITGQNSEDSDRLNRVFDYVIKNFRENIEVNDVARLANMSYSGFCRYFKNRTKKNFTHFVNEMRVGYACRRLIESDLSVDSIGYESGFNNKTNFMEQFRKIVKCTPYKFKKKMQLNNGTAN
ncbi:MAG: AraC family transcriptional regulator [Chitinophagaceae bacterium]|nr:AraC family transcriptional regulator [Chitinophagaceae bacterium]